MSRLYRVQKQNRDLVITEFDEESGILLRNVIIIPRRAIPQFLADVREILEEQPEELSENKTV